MTRISEVKLSGKKKRPWYSLHPLAGIFWATFLSGVVGGCVLIAINYAETERKSASALAVVIGLLSTLLLGATMYVTQMRIAPFNLAGQLLAAAIQALVVVMIAFRLQDRIIERHRLTGGHVASPWVGAGIGALCGFVIGGIGQLLS